MPSLYTRAISYVIPCLVLLNVYLFAITGNYGLLEAIPDDWWPLPVSYYRAPPNPLSDAMDEVVRILLPPEEASNYLRQYPSRNFQFFVYGSLPQNFTWQHWSQCIENRYNVPDWHLHMTKPLKKPIGHEVSNCDWGASICTQTQSSSSEYSSRRFNRNGDVVLSKIFSEYTGPLRTYDASKAHVFIVPYSATAHCACLNDRARCKLVSRNDIRRGVLDHLDYYDETTAKRHVFFSSVQRELNHPFMKTFPLVVTLEVNPDLCSLKDNCGHIIQPYVNTNSDFQPNSPVLLETHANNTLERRPFAIGAVMSQSIGAKVSDRAQFLKVMKQLSQENKTIAGRPVLVSGLERRVLESENQIYDIYRQSIFCPCFRGNTPAQKRFFDALMSGCIPVILEHARSDEPGYSSFFEPNGTSIRLTYPFSKGLFYQEPSMGIDYRELVVTVKATCGMKCIVPTLEDLLENNPQRVRQLQANIASFARLFTYGMEDNAFQYPDAVAAILVQIRHYISST